MRARWSGASRPRPWSWSRCVLLATLVPRALGPDGLRALRRPADDRHAWLAGDEPGRADPPGSLRAGGAADERLGLARAIGARLARGRAVQLAAVVAAAAIACLVAPEQLPDRPPPRSWWSLASRCGVARQRRAAGPTGSRAGPGRGPSGTRSRTRCSIVAVLLLHRSTAVDGGLVAILLATAWRRRVRGRGAVAHRPAPAAPVPIPDGALRFGALHAAGAALLQVVHRGGVVLVAVLAGESAEAGYTALATGVGLGVTYAVLQAFTVSLPHLAGSERPTPMTANPCCAASPRPAGRPARRARSSWRCGLDQRRAGGVRRRLRGGRSRVRPGAGHHRPRAARELAGPGAALRLRPEVALANGVVAATAFVAVGIAAVPAWGAAGGTLAALAGIAAGAVVSVRLLPGASSGRLDRGSLLGAAAVLAVGRARRDAGGRGRPDAGSTGRAGALPARRSARRTAA